MMPEEPRIDVEFYRAEYERIGNELSSNEALGEGRVGLYLGIWSAAVAGAATLVGETEPRRNLATLVVIALVVLLGLGLVTMVRITKRNHQTDNLCDALARMRKLLLKSSPNPELFELALPWATKDDIKPRRPALVHFGLLQVVYFANAAIPVMAWVVLRPKEEMLAAPLLLFVTAYAAQSGAIYFFNEESFRKRKERERQFEDRMKKS